MRAQSLLVVLLSGWILVSCTESPVSVPPVSQIASISDLIRMAGFDPVGMREDGDYVIVEGDIRLSTSDLRRASGLGAHLYHSTYRVDTADANALTVTLVGLAADTAWYNAATDAVAAFNALPNQFLKLSIVGTRDSADIDLELFYNASLVGLAGFPSGGKPYGTIWLDSSEVLTGAQFRWVVAHEIGHALGLRHENLAEQYGSWTYGECGTSGFPNCTTLGDGAYFIPGTLGSGADVNSVMRRGTIGSFTDFSVYDKVALQYLFPLPRVTSVAVTYPGLGSPSFSFSQAPQATLYRLHRCYVVEGYNASYGSFGWSGCEGPVDSTTGATLVHSSVYFTGEANCYYRYSPPEYSEEETIYRQNTYVIEAVFENGSSFTDARGEVFSCVSPYEW